MDIWKGLRSRTAEGFASLALGALLLGSVANPAPVRAHGRPTASAHTHAASAARLPFGLSRWAGDGSATDPAARASGRAAAHSGRTFAFHPSGRQVADGIEPLDFELHPTGHNALEPTLGVDGKNRGFLIATDAAKWPKLPSEALRSGDGGKTWQVVTPMVGGQKLHRDSHDPYLHVDEDTDRVFMADYFPGCTELSFTDDAGETWDNISALCGLGDHQTMFTGRPRTSTTTGYPNVVYYCAIDGFTVAGIAASCLKSLDGGSTFLPAGDPPFRDPGPSAGPGISGCLGYGFIGHGTTAPDGTVYVPRVWCGQPFIAISKDEGKTWTRVQVSNIGASDSGANLDHDAAVAVDRTGNVFYSWAGPDGLARLTVSRDGGATWSTPIEVAPPGLKASALIAIDAASTGKVALSFYGSSANSYGLGKWDGYMMLIPEALGSDPLIHAARVNPPGDPLEGECYYATCRAAREFIDVAIAPDGSVWSPFVDACFDGVCDQGGIDQLFVSTPPPGEAVAARLIPRP